MISVKKQNREQVLCLTDWHVPFEDKTALELAFKFAQHVKPKIIIIHEVMDCYSLSRFDKDPTRLNLLQDEINQAKVYLKKLRDMCPDSRIIHLDSNHLTRIKKYVWRQAQALANLDGLQMEEMMGLREFNIEHKPNFSYKGVIFKHGNKVSQFSAYTAKKEFLGEMTSGASGHTHRLGQFYTRKRGGFYTWIECGCLCTLNPDWYEGVPDWQHGFGLVSFIKNSTRFEMTCIPIIDGKISWGGYEICHGN